MVVTNTVLYIANFNFIRFTKILLRRQVKFFEKVRRKDFLRTNAKYFHGDKLCYPSGIVFCSPNFLIYYDGKFFYCDLSFSSNYQNRQKGTEGKFFEAEAAGRG